MARTRLILVALLVCAHGCKTGGSHRSRMSPNIGNSTNKKQPIAVSPDVQRLAKDIASAKVVPASAELPAPPEADTAGNISQFGNSMQLTEAVSVSLAQNPDLIAIRQTERVGQAAVGVADTYPFNPFVQVQATPFQFLEDQGPGTTHHYVLLMQRIQLAHQQQYREQAARSSLSGIRWNVVQAELQAASLTAQLYFTLLYQRGLRDIARASVDNSQLLLDSTEKRLSAGDASAADVATVKFDTQAAIQQLSLTEATYQASRRDLLRQMGLPPTTPQEFAGNLQSFRWRLPTEETEELPLGQPATICDEPKSSTEAWLANWASGRPDVMAASANVAAARANLALATANRTPDLNIGPYYQRSPDGMTFFGVRADTNLPVIDTGRPLQSQRSAELTQQSTIWRQLLRRAELEGSAAYERYKLALEKLGPQKFTQQTDLPVEFQSLENQFRAGEVDVVRAIQARTSILQNQRSQLDLLNEVAQSAAALLGATGIPLEALFGDEAIKQPPVCQPW